MTTSGLESFHVEGFDSGLLFKAKHEQPNVKMLITLVAP